MMEHANEALKSKDYARAAELYRKAALLAMGPIEGGQIEAFITSLEAWPEGSAQRKLVENEDLLWYSILAKLPHHETRRVMELPSGTELTGRYPNKGAAIAWANHAQALLLADQPDGDENQSPS